MSVERIYWDSDPFLGWLQNEVDKAELCKGTIERAEAGEVLLVTSALTLAEVLWQKGSPKLAQDKLTTLRKFFRRSYVRVVNVTRTIAEEAQEVVLLNGIKPKDAIHVATAVSLKIPILETFDKDLIGKSGLVGSSPLTIRKPLLPKQQKLDL